MADETEGTASAVTRLASELAPMAASLGWPRSSVIMLLGALHDRGRLRLEPPEADVVHGPELVAAIEAAGLKVVRG